MIEFKHVSKTFHGKKIIDDISFQIPDGEFVVLLGESGCGKTTTLKMINKLILPSEGTVEINGRDIAHMDTIALRRRMGYVIQQIGLFPHMTIRENIEIIARMKSKDRDRMEENAIRLMNMVNLDPATFMDAYPSEMSGGQQQRAGVVRAFMAEPEIILMDEPFSALDPITRTQIQTALIDMQTAMKRTIVFVTHDMDEAIKLADRICIIQDGKVAQCDTPENILKHPANQYVTEFIGANRLWANPEYIRAADIMRRRPFTISKGRTVIQALQIMRHNSVDSLLVLDKGQTLLGVVWLEELIGKREADPIEYYISDDYIAVEGETSLKEIIATIDYDVSGIIPVIQHDRKLLGYLTKSIILATMSKQFVPEHTAGERSGVICPATL